MTAILLSLLQVDLNSCNLKHVKLNVIDFNGMILCKFIYHKLNCRFRLKHILLYVDVKFLPLIIKGVAGPGNHQVLLVALPEMVKFKAKYCNQIFMMVFF